MKPVLFFLFLVFAAGCAPALTAAPEPAPTAAPTSTSVPSPVPVSSPTAAPDLLPASGGRVTITGEVLSGGDTTPPGLMDAPRLFVYLVRLEDGSELEVSYTAFPPSPAGDLQKIRLEFHAGQVLPGDLLEAYGFYDPAANRLTVLEEGDYFITRPKP